MKIVCNSIALQADEQSRVKAVPAWVGCTFSNGEECSKEIAEKLVNSVNLEEYSPALLVDHDWSAEKIIGKMVSCALEEDRVVCEFDVYNAEAFEKIKSKEWENISITFDDSDYKILECSIVAIPAIFGAKVWASENKNAHPEEELKEEELAEAVEVAEEPGNVVAPEKEENPEELSESEKARKAFMDARAEDKPAEQEPAEEQPAEQEKPEESEENVCKKDVQNSKNSGLIVENAKLKKELAELKAQIIRNEREYKAETLVNSWVQAGYTLPAQAKIEKNFLLNLFNAGSSLAEQYCSIKDSQGTVGSAILGKRKSVVNAHPTTESEKFAELNEQIISERLERRKH